MKKYRVSRLKQLIWPQELVIDKFHVLTRKRHFPAFWTVSEESIPLSKLASIQIHRGLLFSRLIIENSGGPFPIIIDGLWNNQAKEARDLLELIERDIMADKDVTHLVEERQDNSGPPANGGSHDRGGNPGGSDPPRNNDSDNRNNASMNVADSANGTYNITTAPGQKGANPSQASPNLDYASNRYNQKSDAPPPSGTAVDTIISQSRRFGEIPSDDWTPPAPWEASSKPAETDKWVAGGIKEVDPVEFLNETSATPVATEEKQSAINQLSNWWHNAVSSVQDIKASVPQKKKKRRLN